MARRPTPDPRRRILDVASRLFGAHGVRAVGLQQVVNETGLGKSLFYREFPSKDDLVAAWLHESHALWCKAVDAAIRPYDGDPARQLLAIVELGWKTVASPSFHGSIFHNTSSEFRDPAHPGHQESVAHLRQVRDQFEALARAAGAGDPDGLAGGLMLIMDGLYASGAVLGPTGPARLAVSMAGSFIRQHCPGTGSAPAPSAPTPGDPLMTERP